MIIMLGFIVHSVPLVMITLSLYDLHDSEVSQLLSVCWLVTSDRNYLILCTSKIHGGCMTESHYNITSVHAVQIPRINTV